MRRQADTVAVFDRWAPTYNDCELQPLYQSAHHAVVATALWLGLKPRTVLDVGCGTGQLLAFTAKRFPSATLVGADVSAGMLRNAHPATQTGPPRAHLVQAAVEHLPFADATFDLVTSTVSYRHWTNPTAGLREIHRVLRAGGVLILADVLATNPPTLLTRLSGTQALAHPLTKTELGRTGLQLLHITEVDGYGPVPHLTLLALRHTEPRQDLKPMPPPDQSQSSIPFTQSAHCVARFPWDTMR